MKEHDDDMIAYVRYRLEKSREVYEAACVLYSKEDVDSMMEPARHFIDRVAALVELP